MNDKSVKINHAFNGPLMHQTLYSARPGCLAAEVVSRFWLARAFAEKSAGSSLAFLGVMKCSDLSDPLISSLVIVFY